MTERTRSATVASQEKRGNHARIKLKKDKLVSVTNLIIASIVFFAISASPASDDLPQQQFSEIYAFTNFPAAIYDSSGMPIYPSPNVYEYKLFDEWSYGAESWEPNSIDLLLLVKLPFASDDSAMSAKWQVSILSGRVLRGSDTDLPDISRSKKFAKWESLARLNKKIDNIKGLVVGWNKLTYENLSLKDVIAEVKAKQDWPFLLKIDCTVVLDGKLFELPPRVITLNPPE